MNIGEKIILKNLGECEVLCNISSNKNDILVKNDNNVLCFVTNLNKKRQDNEYGYDKVSVYSLNFNEAMVVIEPVYKDLKEVLKKNYNITDVHTEMVVMAYLNSVMGAMEK